MILSTTGLSFGVDDSVPEVVRLFAADASLGSTSLIVHDVLTGTSEAGWPSAASLGIGSLQALRVSPDRTKLALAGGSTPYLRVLDIATKAIDAGWPTMASIRRGLSWSPDGSKLATFSDSGTLLQVIDVASLTVEGGWTAPSAGSYNRNSQIIRYSPDGARLCVCHSGGYTVYDVATKAPEAGWPTLTGTTPGVIGCDWSPDGSLLALSNGSTSGTQRKLHVIDVATKTEESGWPEFLAATSSARGPRFSADGTKLAIGRVGSVGVDHLAVIDVATKAIESGWYAGDSSLEHIEWSEDGLWLGIGRTSSPDHTHLYDAATKALVWDSSAATQGTDLDFA